jgi:hypothetical protein
MSIKSLFEKFTGVDKIKAQLAEEAAESIRLAREAQAAAEEANKLRSDSEAAAKKAAEEEELAKLNPKERATRKGEAWVAVLDTKVNPDNIRNGFFELDWNDLFILQLRQAGYGSEGDLEEEIVDRWFRDIVSQMLEDEGMDTNRGAGYINVVPISKGKSQVS